MTDERDEMRCDRCREDRPSSRRSVGVEPAVSIDPLTQLQDRPPNFRSEDGRLFLVRCFACDIDHGVENWAMAVASGQCAWCGWQEDRRIPTGDGGTPPFSDSKPPTVGEATSPHDRSQRSA